MKVLLLGKSGLLGWCFFERLQKMKDVEWRAFDRDGVDVTNLERLEKLIKDFAPDIVINCTATTDVDGCETNRELAFSVNAVAVREMARICKELDAIFIHISTDYVFDGKNKAGYNEDDQPSPINVYGESKLEGEKLIRKSADRYYIIRSSWLYGENGENFVDKMLWLAESKEELDVVDDQVGSPTLVDDLAEAVIDNFLRLDDLKPFGIYHLTNSGSCSWNEFAQEIFSLRGLETKVNKVGSEAFPRAAERPKSSILVNSKLVPMRPWKEALSSYLMP